MGADFAELVRLCKALEATGSRNAKVALLSKYFRGLSPEDAKVAAYLLLGLPPDVRGRPLSVGWATIQEALKAKPTAPLVEEPLTLRDLWSSLRALASLQGSGSRARKVAVLQSLFRRFGGEELGWVLRILSGEMRHGVNHGLLLEAVAAILSAEIDYVRRMDMLVNDVGELVRMAVSGELGKVELKLFNPVRPMLAETCESIEEALRLHGGQTSLEPKYDGVRVQIHIDGPEIRVYTRRLTDITERVPDVAEIIRGAVASRSAVLDGEVVAVDESGKALPFQETMRRVGRERDVAEAVKNLPLKLWIFDVLYLDGEAVIDRVYEERRRRLEAVVRPEVLAPRVLTGDPAVAEEFLRRVLDAGHEGVLAKEPRSVYTPGRRGAKWLKVKPAERLDVVIVAAEWGHGRRRGWLSNYHLAVLDEESGNFAVVGKTFKGLTDEEFEYMTRRLLSLKTEEFGWGVTVKPEIVVEVAYNEIQRSPHYESGLALRFARIVRIREDKSPRDADTLQRLRTLYRRQFEKKGRPTDGESLAYL
ncbi:MAG: ATP-dependent DNA ligase [Nitrososphaerota archaeon]|nr:ATP-dependent DNA ligase [Candidatus Calditenuaceae archaeon]MDW8073863.1 ATP-dependent DNA ligase [Nitrososphaerota archaeon]